MQSYALFWDILIKKTLLTLHWTAWEARNISEGSANLSHSSALHSPGKPRRLAAAAASNFHASEAAGKDTSCSKFSLASPEETIPVWASEAWAQQAICGSRIAKNDLVVKFTGPNANPSQSGASCPTSASIACVSISSKAARVFGDFCLTSGNIGNLSLLKHLN